MFRFIHAADLHLDSPLIGLERYEGAPVEQMRNAPRRALENLVSLALAESVAFVVIAGDIYDGDWRDHNTGLFFARQMSRLREAGIPVVMIAGNHDAASRMTRSLRLPDNVEMLPSEAPATASHPRLAELGVAIHGQSFARPDVQENLARGYPAARRGLFNIGLLHTSLEDPQGHDCYAPCTIDDLRQKEYDYWALGHIHKRQVVARDPLIVYPGNTQGRQVRETGARGCCLVSAGDRGGATLEFRPLDVVRWEIAVIDVPESVSAGGLLDQFAAVLAGLMREHDGLPLALRVVLRGATRMRDQLLADEQGWNSEFRQAATDQSGGLVWLERVVMDVTSAGSGVEMTGDDGPLAALQACIRELQSSDELLGGLARGLEDLRRKLPAELVSGPERLGLDDLVQIRNWLDQVGPMLAARLTGRARS